MILIHPISPIAISLFGLNIRWYAIAYIAAFVIGFQIFKKLTKNSKLSGINYDDLLSYVILGVIIGGRVGYVLFYNLPFFMQNPLEIFAVWHGGMSFHGGLAGVIGGVFLFARRLKNLTSPALQILDRIAIVAPIGLFFGRIANFINMEVMGRATDVAWAVVFSGIDSTPRHPSPLYEAALEGIILFLIMWNLRNKNWRAGTLSGIFAIFYGIFRIFCEQFRQPDVQLGFLLGTNWLTMGTILSLAMIIIGAGLIFHKKSVRITPKH